MKLLYMTSVSYPSRLANRYQTVEMARQFERLVPDFILGGHSIGNESGVTHIRNFPGSQRSFLLGFRYALCIHKEKITHVFSRESNLIYFAMLYARLLGCRPKFTFEVHDIPEHASYLFMSVIRRVDMIIVLTSVAKADLVAAGISGERVFVAADAVDPTPYKTPISKERARTHLSLPKHETLILYTGHLYEWKGVQTLADAALLGLPEGSRVYFVGGTEKDLVRFRERNAAHQWIQIVGHVDRREIPIWLAAADIAVLPNSAMEKISSRYTSPLKLFEYMAAGKPIVASDLPSIRDVLDESSAFFFVPDDPASLSAAIRKALENPHDAEKRAREAVRISAGYTWQARAESILRAIHETP